MLISLAAPAPEAASRAAAFRSTAHFAEAPHFLFQPQPSGQYAYTHTHADSDLLHPLPASVRHCSLISVEQRKELTRVFSEIIEHFASESQRESVVVFEWIWNFQLVYKLSQGSLVRKQERMTEVVRHNRLRRRWLCLGRRKNTRRRAHNRLDVCHVGLVSVGCDCALAWCQVSLLQIRCVA